MIDLINKREKTLMQTKNMIVETDLAFQMFLSQMY